MYEKGRAGVVTTNDRKTKYTDAALTYFNMVSNLTPIYTLNRQLTPDTERRALCKRHGVRQCVRYDPSCYF